jgi:hypothetical protein
MFSGLKSNESNNRQISNQVNVTQFNREKESRSNVSSISPDRSKQAAVAETSKPSEPAPKKTSLFGGGKKDRLNPFMRKSSNPKSPDELNKPVETA